MKKLLLIISVFLLSSCVLNDTKMYLNTWKVSVTFSNGEKIIKTIEDFSYSSECLELVNGCLTIHEFDWNLDNYNSVCCGVREFIELDYSKKVYNSDL